MFDFDTTVKALDVAGKYGLPLVISITMLFLLVWFLLRAIPKALSELQAIANQITGALSTFGENSDRRLERNELRVEGSVTRIEALLQNELKEEKVKNQELYERLIEEVRSK